MKESQIASNRTSLSREQGIIQTLRDVGSTINVSRLPVWKLVQEPAEIGLKSLKSIALTLVFVFFSFFPTGPLLGNVPGELGSQLAMAAPAPSTELGTIPGEFSVNGNGGATYTVAMEVPPGTNGVQPNLSLVYRTHLRSF